MSNLMKTLTVGNATYEVCDAAAREALLELDTTLSVEGAAADAKAVGDAINNISLKNGEDGFSPVATVEQTNDGAVISITDKNGTTTATVVNGKDGAQGEKGDKGDKGDTGAKGIQGEKGDAGTDGVSPTVSVIEWDDGHRVYITDANGNHIFDIPNGTDGADGTDGVSPTVSVTEYPATHKVSITDVNGTQTFYIPNGNDGVDGKDGADGADGVSVTHEWEGTTLHITSASGYSAANLKGEKGDTGDQGIQGEKGDPGDKGDKGDTGADGADGVSPTVEVERITGGTKVSITDVNGTKSFNVMNGESSIGGLAEVLANTSDYTTKEIVVPTVDVTFTDSKFTKLENLGATTLVKDAYYIVYWNGTRYEEQCFEDDGVLYLGNGSFMYMDKGSDAPFLIMSVGNETGTLYKADSTTETVSIRVDTAEPVEITQTIPKEYLPDDIGGGVTVSNVATPGQMLLVKSVDTNGAPTEWETADVPNGSGGEGCGIVLEVTEEKSVLGTEMPDTSVHFTSTEVALHEVYDRITSEMLQEGVYYEVRWNDEPYIVQCYSTDKGTLYAGNGSIIGFGDDTGEPFVLYYDGEANYIAQPDSVVEDVTIGIDRISYSKTEKIPEKYLPDDIGGGMEFIDRTEAGQIPVIKSVDEFGQPTMWETVALPEAPQPDWNASEGEPGHVLNRTHYESVGLKEILPTTEQYFDTENGTFSESFMLIEGENYTVTWDGETYECIAIKANITGDTKIVIGDTGMWGIGERNNMPFVIWADLNGNTGADVTTWKVSHTFSIAMHENVLKRLDGKFLPEGLPYSEIVQGNPTFDGNLSGREYVQMDEGVYLVKMSDQMLTVDDLVGSTVTGIMEGEPMELVISSEVVQDSTSEGVPIVVCLVDDMPVVMSINGDVSAAIPLAMTTGTYFICVPGMFHITSLSCLTGEMEKIHKLDGKYLPDGVPYSETEIIEPTFNGNLAGREYVRLGDAQIMVKMSDQTFTADELVGATIVGNMNGEVSEVPITSDMVSSSGGLVQVMYGNIPVVLSLTEEISYLSMTTGTYFMYMPGTAYMMSLSCLTEPYVKETIHKLDAKYLPVTLPEVSSSDNGDVLQVKNGEWTNDHLNYNDLTNKPTLSRVATSGSYNDLSNKPTIPAAYTHPSTHPASMITGLAKVATSGSYNDLSNKPISLPANGGNADTVDNKHASDFAAAEHEHSYLGLIKNKSLMPAYVQWKFITYGNGKFVAVSANNVAGYSEDGMTWTKITLPTSSKWESVAYGNDKFVAVAYDSSTVAYSEDGISWGNATLPSEYQLQSITYGNGKFVAVSASTESEAVYSGDGLTWTETTIPGSKGWKSVTYGNGKFVAGGDEQDVIAYSEDGITWTTVEMPSDFSISSSWDVTFGNDKFVAVSGADSAFYSEDGITWIETEIESAVRTPAIYGNGKFVTIDTYKEIAAYSEDGVTWKYINVPSGKWGSVAYGDDKFIAIGSYITENIVSTDGINWKKELVTITQDGVDVTEHLTSGSYNDLTDKPIPDASSVSEGAFLRVVNGAWAAVVLPNVEDGEF